MLTTQNDKVIPHKLGTVSIAFAVAMLCLSTAFADDTEVFFSRISNNAGDNPNVLFVIDTSTSMNAADQSTGGLKTRLETMQEAMSTVLSESNDVNVGLMRFNGYLGANVLYPITPLDHVVCESANCGEVHISSKLNGAENDVEERGNGLSILSGGTLTLQTKDPDRTVGMRFPDIKVPKGATITHASFTFVAGRNNSEDKKDPVIIRAEDVASAEPYSNADHTASDRNYTQGLDWYPEQWKRYDSYTSRDVSQIVQEVVNREDWCNGNPMAFSFTGDTKRDIYGYEKDPIYVPILNISYDSGSVSDETGGCNVTTVTQQINFRDDDAEEYPNLPASLQSNDLELFTEWNLPVTVGLRFNDLNIPKNAVITESYIEFYMKTDSTGNNSADIFGEASDAPATYNTEINAMANRPKTTAVVPWNNLTPRKAGEKLVTPDISSIINELTNRSSWQPGNSMAFNMVYKASSGVHVVESHEGKTGLAPRLVVKYQEAHQADDDQKNNITARDEMINLINGISAEGDTPIVGAFWEAANYMLGNNVDYGTSRGWFGRDFESRSRFHRLSHPLSYVGGTVFRPDGCSERNLDSIDCLGELITGNAVYTSPIQASCQANHVVLLTDGEASDNTNAPNKIRNGTGLSCAGMNNPGEECGSELATWLASTDHSPLPGKQSVITNTIGFNHVDPFLNTLALNGNGRYYQANNVDDLKSSFEDLFTEVQEINTSFVAPGATVNQSNRLAHRNDIYFALFQPNQRPNWSGNLKQYEIGLDDQGEVTVFDDSTPPQNAIDEETGFFSDTARSGWSTVTDGGTVAVGGAAEALKNKSVTGAGFDARQVYTMMEDINDIPASGYDIRTTNNLLHEANANISEDMLGVSGNEGNVSGADLTRENLLKWARGFDVKDDDADQNTDELRQHMGDAIHSRPVILNYDNGTSEPLSTVFVGTNEGLLHAIDTENGDELFSFMPPSLLGNVKANFINSSATDHQYGVDGPISTWHEDTNNNGLVDSNEVAMLFVGMRRGGRNYYAFDVSDRKNPKLKWVVKGGQDKYVYLGQSWSRMVPTKIVYQGEERNVVIFGGGYDTSNDVDYSIGAQPKEHDSVGNTIYMVDSLTGEHVYTLGDTSDRLANQRFAAMDFSIPSDVRVLDLDGNGFADSLFVGDLGGQVWRFDFDLYHARGTYNLLHRGVIPMATLGLPHSDVSNNRRFFYPPDVALIEENNERFLSISIGSGWRSHPLNTDVNDAFFMLRSNDVYNAPAGYGKPSLTGNSYESITEGDLSNVSSTVNNSVSPYGWMLPFDELGEKVLGSSITVNSQVIFTTYRPEAAVELCSAGVGEGSVYSVDVNNGNPSLDLDNNNRISTNDRSAPLANGGIPPEATALIVEGTVNGETVIKPAILVGPEQPLDSGSIFENNLTQRGSWVDAGMTEEGAAGASIDDY